MKFAGWDPSNEPDRSCSLFVLMTEYGQFPVPADMMALYQTARLSKARRQPDRRTKLGKQFAARFKEFTAEKAREHMAPR